jgi:hypothetical protein
MHAFLFEQEKLADADAHTAPHPLPISQKVLSHPLTDLIYIGTK